MIYKRGDCWYTDITIEGVRYRESLNTTDKREASNKEKDRIAAIKAGKGASKSKSAREFAKKPIAEAAQQHFEERQPHISARTQQLERERLRPLLKVFDKPLARVRASDCLLDTGDRAQRILQVEIGLVGFFAANEEIGSLSFLCARTTSDFEAFEVSTDLRCPAVAP